MPVIDSREVTDATIASIVITPNIESRKIVADEEVITYHNRIVVRYSLQDEFGHLEYKNATHQDAETDKKLTDKEVALRFGIKEDVKADVLLLSDKDIDN
ncbi:hypothetical protein KAR91_76570 [Candidatus Pacearchaeota archaeon]|nr:hypothetical protein [Candidatus Pacearchaeota archaeon]